MQKLIQHQLDRIPGMNDQLAIKKFIPGIAWFFLVLVLICLPGDNIPKVESWLTAIFFDKWVHAGLFAILTFLFIYPLTRSDLSQALQKNMAIKIVLAAVIWGLATECIQKFFVPGRDFDIFDWMADGAGVLAAYIYCYKKYLTK